jgi:predicted ribosomally synthesized peptide with SipW-like signal peptide
MKLVKSIFMVSSVLILAIAATNSVFSDSAKVDDNEFSTGTWHVAQARVVINEVYYDVDASHGSEPGDEWIELYNGGDAAINLKDWTITDNSTSRTIHAASHTLNPGQFALIAKDNSVWSLYWSVPAGVEIIELGLNIGNGLSNAGDRLILKDDGGNIVDQISYGTDTTILSPAIFDVVEGHSIERSPDGLDTDTSADFVDRLTPIPGS